MPWNEFVPNVRGKNWTRKSEWERDRRRRRQKIKRNQTHPYSQGVWKSNVLLWNLGKSCTQSNRYSIHLNECVSNITTVTSHNIMSTIYKKHQCATGYRLQTQASFIYELSNCCSSHPHSRAQCVAYTSLLIRQMILLHWRQTTDLFFNEGELQNAHKIHPHT